MNKGDKIVRCNSMKSQEVLPVREFREAAIPGPDPRCSGPVATRPPLEPQYYSRNNVDMVSSSIRCDVIEQVDL